MNTAPAAVFTMCVPGDVCLHSPGAPGFGQFDSYREKSIAFRDAILEFVSYALKIHSRAKCDAKKLYGGIAVAIFCEKGAVFRVYGRQRAARQDALDFPNCRMRGWPCLEGWLNQEVLDKRC
jgi:hypothetical protein